MKPHRLTHRILDLQREGLTGQQVATRLGVAQTTVSQIARDAGSPFPRLTPQQAQELRERYAAAPMHRRPDLAGLYGQMRRAAAALDYDRLATLTRTVSDAWAAGPTEVAP